MALTTNLVSYYKLDEASGNRSDSHGSNTLTDNNTVGSATGVINNAADFEKDNVEYLSRAGTGLFNFGGADFSINLWFNAETTIGGPALIGKDTAGANRQWVVLLDWNNANVSVFLFINDSTYFGRRIPNSSLSVSTPYMVTVTRSVSTFKIYLNGSDQTLTDVGNSAIGTIQDTTTEFRIGVFANDTGPFDGLIDEVGIWTRALTGQEVTDLYNSGTGLSYDNFGAGGGGASRAVTRRGRAMMGVGR
jgi:hypothetical protein